MPVPSELHRIVTTPAADTKALSSTRCAGGDCMFHDTMSPGRTPGMASVLLPEALTPSVGNVTACTLIICPKSSFPSCGRVAPGMIAPYQSIWLPEAGADGGVTITVSVVRSPMPVAAKFCAGAVTVSTAAGVSDRAKRPIFQTLPTGDWTVSGRTLEFGPGLEPSTLVTAGKTMCAP